MITLQNVTKKYNGAIAVDALSFEVKEGETLVLLGMSGCGKTTSLRMINRLEEPTSGSIFFQEKNIQHENAQDLRRKMGYVLQHTGLFPHYTIAENIATVPQLLHWPKQKIKQRTELLLEKLKLDPEKYKDRFPNQLSGGQQQRVGLARALAADPPVLVMDEPFGALDPVTRIAIRRDFKQLDELVSKTIILVTHDVQEAFELADRICLMDQGKIVQIGAPSALLFQPAQPFVSSFLNEQHLLLELQTITINDVWHELHDAGKTFAQHEVFLHDHLWTALQQIAAKPRTADNFYVEKDGVKKILNTVNIMAAYQQYKWQQTHE